jgi:hypothetical protein
MHQREPRLAYAALRLRETQQFGLRCWMPAEISQPVRAMRRNSISWNSRTMKDAKSSGRA